MALYRSYGRASTKVKARNERDPNFLGAATYKEDMVKIFIDVLHERRSVLESEIVKGGHQNSAEMFHKVSKMVEDKVRSNLTQGMLNNKDFNSSSFEKLVRDLKVDVRNIFYKGYLGN